MSEHLSEQHVASWLEHLLTPDELSLAETHVDGCVSCRELLSEAAQLLETPEPAVERMGRYEVVSLLGQGAMGVVHLARDLELQRKVALKVLRAPEKDVARARMHLFQEARALARLSHPHVVTVHEVGEDLGRVFLVMEFVEGGTLRRWSALAPRPWREVVRMLQGAGEGLGAAHAAGMVHRDFKPENVLLGADGRARVTDFGLAGELGGTEPDCRELVGTPAYMSPEQLDGERADARSDQFSFCVVLWEALLGARPFLGETPSALQQAIRAGPPTPPSFYRLPRSVQAVLRRGLQAAPGERFPAMSEVLAALRPSVSQRRRRVLVGASLLALLVGAGTSLVLARGRCEALLPLSRELRWPARAEALESAFHARGAPYAPTTFDTLHRRVERYLADWDTAHREVCALPSDAARAPREACLQQRAQTLRETLEVLSQPTASALRSAVAAGYAVPQPRSCVRLGQVEDVFRIPDSRAAAEQVRSARERLAHVRALFEVAELGQAKKEMTPLGEESRKLGFAPLTAEVLAMQAALQFSGEPQAAEATLVATLEQARTARYVFLEGWTWLRLGRLAAAGGQPGLARTRAQASREVLARTSGDRELEAQLERLEAQIAGVELDPGNELRHRRQTVVLLRQQLHAGDPLLATVLLELADLLLEQGQLEEAGAVAGEASALDQLTLGALHPSSLFAKVRLAQVALEKGQSAQAVVLLRETRQALRADSDQASRDGAWVDGVLASALEAEGHPEEALVVAAEAVRQRRASATKDRLGLTEALAAEGQLLRRLGREGEGVERARAAARLLEGVTLRGARSVKSSLRVARLLVDSALAPGAETLVTRTLQVLEAPSAHDDRSLAEALELAGECALDQGDAARARTLFARSQTQRNLPRTQLALIKLAALEPRRRAGAVRLARELLRALKSSPEDLAMGFNLRRWIAGLAAARTPGSSG